MLYVGQFTKAEFILRMFPYYVIRLVVFRITHLMTQGVLDTHVLVNSDMCPELLWAIHCHKPSAIQFLCNLH